MHFQGLCRTRSARRPARWPAALVALPVLALLAASGTAASATAAPVASASVTSTSATSPSATSPSFHQPVRIDNPLFALRPGTTFTFTGTITDADGVHPHQVIFTVTDLVKPIDGVLTRVIWDRDVEDGELTEAELAFFAQSDHRDVYTMGEYPEEYDGGTFTGAPDTWISGQAGAQGGILVPGRPRVGLRFVQGRAPAIEFLDVGVVKRSHEPACAEVGCFADTTLVEESSPLAPEDGKQLKYYAPGAGLVKIGAVGGDSREVMTLSRVQHLGPAALARARAAVLSMERRGYRVSRPYRHTLPMRQCRGLECT